MQLRVELARREHNEDVVRVRVDGRDEPSRAQDARLLENLVVRGLAEQSEIAFGQALLQDILVLFHHYERHIIDRELVGDLSSDPAVATKYVVAV